MAKIKTVVPSLAKSTLKAPPALVLKTPAGSSMKAGSNTQPWENTGSYTADQTAAGYGDVPAMTMNAPAPVSPTPLQALTGVDGLANSYKKFMGTSNYQTDNGYMTGGLGNYGSYTDPVSGQTVHLDQASYDAIKNPYGSDGTTSPDGLSLNKANDITGASLSNMAGLAQAGISLFNGINSYNLGKKNLSLAKDMFGFEKAATNRNMTNQATEYNTGVQNRGEVGMSLAGNTMDQGARDARQAQLNSYKISTAPIG